jgi:outer membrane protein
MKRGLAVLLTAWLSGAALVSAQEAAGDRKLYDLNEAVELAMHQNPRLLASRHQSSANRDAASSTRGHLLPLVKVGTTYDYVQANEGLDLGAFGGGSSGSSSSSSSMPLHLSAWAGDFNVTLAQPLLGLVHISQDFAAADKMADASKADLHASEAELRSQVEAGFLSLFEARAEKDIALASHDQLTDQLRVVQAEFKDGTRTRADVLRFQVAAANADQQQIQAQVDDDNAKDQLLGLLGLAGHVDRDQVDFLDPTDELLKRPLPTDVPDVQEKFAESHRPEMFSAQLQTDAAWHRKQARYFGLLPEINASYSYYRLLNTPEALPRDINLFGLSASWNIWDWGTNYYQAHAAGEQLGAAEANRESVREQIDVEVRTRLSQERAAANAVHVASDAISQAEEAFRVTSATVRAGAATTTDLLDAQAALTQARQNLVRSKYEELRARSLLQRALGSEQG